MATIDSMNKDSTRLSDGPDWTFDLLDVYLAEIDRVAKQTGYLPAPNRGDHLRTNDGRLLQRRDANQLSALVVW